MVNTCTQCMNTHTHTQSSSSFMAQTNMHRPTYRQTHSLTSSTGCRAVRAHYTPAVVGFPLSARQGVLPQHAGVLPLQKDLSSKNTVNQKGVTCVNIV